MPALFMVSFASGVEVCHEYITIAGRGLLGGVYLSFIIWRHSTCLKFFLVSVIKNAHFLQGDAGKVILFHQ